MSSPLHVRLLAIEYAVKSAPASDELHRAEQRAWFFEEWAWKWIMALPDAGAWATDAHREAAVRAHAESDTAREPR